MCPPLSRLAEIQRDIFSAWQRGSALGSKLLIAVGVWDVVIAAAGRAKIDVGNRSDALVAFALPEELAR